MKAKRKTKEPIVIAVTTPKGARTDYVVTVIPGESIQIVHDRLENATSPTEKMALPNYAMRDIRGAVGREASQWIMFGLTFEQKCELAEVVQDSPGIAGDWIEDHGGERSYLEFVELAPRSVKARKVDAVGDRVGDTAEHDSYNLSYMGRILSITSKTVTIEDHGGKRRLSLYEFCWRNWDGIEKKLKRNANWSD